MGNAASDDAAAHDERRLAIFHQVIMGDRVTIDGGIVEDRQIDRRRQGLRQNASVQRGQWHLFGRRYGRNAVGDKGDGRFEPREVTLGRRGEGFVEVRSGLEESDRVVTAANFLIDSESNLRAALQTLAGVETAR
jgi:multidrug efflux pump subunit AcrA (membrane-fusion protein)